MTITSKISIVIAAVIILALLGFYFMHMNAHETAATQDQNEEYALPTPASDTSDTALAEDAAAIDAELEGLDDDSATVSESFAEAQNAQ